MSGRFQPIRTMSGIGLSQEGVASLARGGAARRRFGSSADGGAGPAIRTIDHHRRVEAEHDGRLVEGPVRDQPVGAAARISRTPMPFPGLPGGVFVTQDRRHPPGEGLDGDLSPKRVEDHPSGVIRAPMCHLKLVERPSRQSGRPWVTPGSWPEGRGGQARGTPSSSGAVRRLR
jgi:hypothetical protein